MEHYSEIDIEVEVEAKADLYFLLPDCASDSEF